jgi:hypothetical protein
VRVERDHVPLAFHSRHTHAPHTLHSPAAVLAAELVPKGPLQPSVLAVPRAAVFAAALLPSVLAVARAAVSAAVLLPSTRAVFNSAVTAFCRLQREERARSCRRREDVLP